MRRRLPFIALRTSLAYLLAAFVVTNKLCFDQLRPFVRSAQRGIAAGSLPRPGPAAPAGSYDIRRRQGPDCNGASRTLPAAAGIGSGPVDEDPGYRAGP